MMQLWAGHWSIKALQLVAVHTWVISAGCLPYIKWHAHLQCIGVLNTVPSTALLCGRLPNEIMKWSLPYYTLHHILIRFRCTSLLWILSHIQTDCHDLLYEALNVMLYYKWNDNPIRTEVGWIFEYSVYTNVTQHLNLLLPIRICKTNIWGKF